MMNTIEYFGFLNEANVYHLGIILNSWGIHAWFTSDKWSIHKDSNIVYLTFFYLVALIFSLHDFVVIPESAYFPKRLHS